MEEKTAPTTTKINAVADTVSKIVNRLVELAKTRPPEAQAEIVELVNESTTAHLQLTRYAVEILSPIHNTTDASRREDMQAFRAEIKSLQISLMSISQYAQQVLVDAEENIEGYMEKIHQESTALHASLGATRTYFSKFLELSASITEDGASKPKPLPQLPKKLPSTLSFNASMPNLLAFSPRSVSGNPTKIEVDKTLIVETIAKLRGLTFKDSGEDIEPLTKEIYQNCIYFDSIAQQVPEVTKMGSELLKISSKLTDAVQRGHKEDKDVHITKMAQLLRDLITTLSGFTNVLMIERLEEDDDSPYKKSKDDDSKKHKRSKKDKKDKKEKSKNTENKDTNNNEGSNKNQNTSPKMVTSLSSSDTSSSKLISPRLTEDYSENPISIEMYSPELVFKKTNDGEVNIAIENSILEGAITAAKNFWQEIASEPPTVDDQEDFNTGKNFFRKLRTKSITLTKRALKALDLDEKGTRKSDDNILKRQSFVALAERDRSKSKSMDANKGSPFKKAKDRRVSEAPPVKDAISKRATITTTPTKEKSPSRPESPMVQRPGGAPALRWTDVGAKAKKFEEPDHEENIQFTDVNEKQIISACTLEKLMQKLTLDGYPSADLINSFLITYRQFLSPKALFQLVEYRWNSYPPLGMDVDEFKAKKLLVIRFKVFNLLKGWVEKGYDEDFKDDPELLETLQNFIERMSNDGLPKQAERLQETLQKKRDGDAPEVISNHQCPKRILVPLLSLAQVSILNFHPEEFVRQVTLLEQQYFKKILPKELLGVSWTKKNKDKLSPNVVAMIQFSNHFVSLLANEVLRAGDLRTRVLVMNRVITVGMIFLKLGNFNGVFETHSALMTGAIYRMRSTWNSLPDETWANFLKLKAIANSDSNYRNYREALNTAEPPRLPYLGRYLGDFLFVDEKYPDRLPDTELINFGKMQSLASILQNIKFNQGHRYWFEEVDKIQDYIKNYEPLDNKRMYALSLKREPREVHSNVTSAPTSPRNRSVNKPNSSPNTLNSISNTITNVSDQSDSSANSSMTNSVNNSMTESYGNQTAKKTSM